MITNDVSDSYQLIYVIAHIICNHLYTVRKPLFDKSVIKLTSNLPYG